MLSYASWPTAIGHGLLCLIGAAALCAAVIILLHRLFPVSAELMRKLLHLSVVLMLSVWLYAFPQWGQAELVMAVFLIVVYVILVFLEKHKSWTLFARLTSERSHGELRKSLFAVSLMFMLLTAVAWGWLGERRLALAAILAWGPGDAAAALIGKRYGKTKLGRAKKKSLEGTLAMFTLSFLCVLASLLRGGFFPPRYALPTALLTAAVTAAVELADHKGLDTISCPTAALAVLCLAQLLLG